jgi:hypothetical protein
MAFYEGGVDDFGVVPYSVSTSSHNYSQTFSTS